MIAPEAKPGELTALGEFATRWPVLLGAIFGIGLGIIALPSPAIGVVMRDLQAEFGWTRTQISVGPTILITSLALASPLLGWIADRVSAMWISGVSMIMLALFLFLLSQMNGDLAVYYAAFAAMGVFACGSGAIVYARAVSANFVQGRGLALGLAMTGNGLASILLPMLLVPYAASAGWRQGFIALAILVALAAPLVAWLMNRSRPQAADRAHGCQPAAGASLKAALRDRTFWIMAVAFALIPLSAAGMHLHLIAYLVDHDLPREQAGVIASLGGLTLLVTRVMTGWLIDRIFAPLVAAAMMAISAACMAAMAALGAPAGWLGAIAIGLALGAEIDLIGYFAARYFGLDAFGRIYGLLYAAVLAGGALSPVLYGQVIDITHSYDVALYGAAALLFVAAALFLLLPQFPGRETSHQA